jgi:3-oxoacyl-[acyl-carrier protein] reductase
MTTTPRTAVVTGAAGAIGLAAVVALLQAGGRVVMVDRDAAALAKASTALDATNVEAVALDITDAAAGATITQAAEKRGWPAVTILVNNAAIAPRPGGITASAVDITRETWQQVLDVNLTAPMFLVQQFLPDMQAAGWGRIVNVSSFAARFKPNNAGPAYVASKAALLGLTRSLAATYGPEGITCNAVAPGLVPAGLSGEITPERRARILDGTALKRVGTAQEMGETIAFLASDAAGYITGACIDVNGGAGMA